MAIVKNFYAGSNSSVGFYSLYEDALKDLDRIFILKGGPGTGKSTFMRKIGLVFIEKGFDLEYLHCSSDNQSIDGIIIPKLKLGFVDGTSPHLIEPKYPGVRETFIDLGTFSNHRILRAHKNKLIKLIDDRAAKFQAAYQIFAQAKKVHLEKEKLYLSSMNFEKANKITKQLIEQIFTDQKMEEETPSIKKRFFGAATPKGAVNFIDNITENIQKRYIIKGRPGSGKSTLMKKIGKFAEEKGVSVEYYPCAFDPNSIDMVIIPSFSTAILDGTAPHVVDAFRKNDEIVDMFELCMDRNVEKKHKRQLQNLDMEYKNKMALGTNYLSEAKRLQDLLEEYYKQSMNFDAVNEKREQVLKEVFEN
jgi:ATPase subunit of ABC transporter with duplicated ATPase domains